MSEITAEQAEKTKEFAYGELTRENATEFVQELDKVRAEKCNAEVAKVLDKYNCRIDVIEIRRNGQLESYQVQVVAL